MAKPNINTDWNVSDNGNRVEPSPGIKNTGIADGGTWGREWLNWMFYGINRWINWVRDDAMDRTENLNDLADKAESRTNLDVYSKSESEAASAIITGEDNSSFYQEATISASGDMTGGSAKVIRVGNLVTISGTFTHSSFSYPETATNSVPDWALPNITIVTNAYQVSGPDTKMVRVWGGSSKYLSFEFNTPLTSTGGFSISYTV